MAEDIFVSTMDGIATVTLNRPDQRNAMNYEMWQDLGRICLELDSDPDVRVVILRGSGNDAFSAGADIKEFDQKRSNSNLALKWAGAIDGALDGLELLRKPSIALIKGYCIGGGCELACFADIRICSDTAIFGVPAARLGISIGYKEMRRLIELVGLGNVNYILLSARMINASDALRMGLVNQVVPVNEIDEYTSKLASSMAALAPLSHRDNKQIASLVLANPGLHGFTPEQEALPYRVFDSYDYREGRRAFVEKRRPNFQGR